MRDLPVTPPLWSSALFPKSSKGIRRVRDLCGHSQQKNKYDFGDGSEYSISNLIDELEKSAEHWDKNGRDDMFVEEVRLEDLSW
eukprot:CAMPEP_0203693366 /NCGR_PEP_ID=MMETSP0091-20130426/5347_1 /ASSEMBLY_ACC=CAM_ASM_001089 /TAXON_ID=426623 /ORGANISM="Chaetoceros affinis, Strain CCMP159" /LENGTH=83 /DNA_ID=CAMNT_0050564435 /DNA_START=158 /DNA_END=406 /DNA_ORIENTATION=+